MVGKVMAVVLAVVVGVGTARGQLDTQWVKQYDGYSSDLVNDHIQTADGGFALVGYSSPVDSLGVFLSLIKCNANGDSVWGRFFRCGHWTRGYAVIQTEDQGFFLAGYVDPSFDNEEAHDDVIVIRTNSEGDSLWGHRYTGIAETQGLCAIQTRNGNYAIGGSSRRRLHGNEDMYLLMLDENGDSLWSRSYGGNGVEVCNDIIQTSDGSLALAGSTNSIRNGPESYWVLFVDENGDSLDSYVEGYRTAEMSFAYTLQEFPNGTLMVSGSALSLSNYNITDFIWTVGLNERHHRIWQRLDGVREDFYSQTALASCKTSDGMVALTGSYRHYPEGGPRTTGYWIEKIRPSSALEFDQIWETSDQVWSHSIIQTADGCYSIAGCLGQDRGSRQFLLKTTPDPAWSGVIEDKATSMPEFSYSAYPSPFNSTLTISYSSPTDAPLLISLVDLSGRTLERNWVRGTAMGKGVATIGTNALPSGNYFILVGEKGVNGAAQVRCLK